MASLEAKILKEDRKDNYASDSDSAEEFQDAVSTANPVMDGPQTGPKGVLRDYKRFEESTKEEGKKQTAQQMQQLKSTVTNFKSDPETKDGQMESEFPEDKQFLKAYREKRLQEMKEPSKAPQTNFSKKYYYGNLFEIRGDKYADVIDNAPKDVVLLIHIYDEFLSGCRLLNKVLTQLAKRYPSVKFCRVQAFQVQVSEKFKKDGLPAMLVYKNGDIIGNFLKVTDDLGKDFVVEDVETFLQDKGCIPLHPEETGTVICKLTGHRPPPQELSDDD